MKGTKVTQLDPKALESIVDAAIKRADRITNVHVDQTIDRSATPIEVSMIDKVFRPFNQLLEVHRATDQSCHDFVISAWWVASIIAAEAILAVYEGDEVVTKTDEFMHHYNKLTAQMVAVNVADRGNTKAN